MDVALIILLASNNGCAQEFLGQEQIAEPLFEKVYVSPDRIFVCSEGLFYLNKKGDVIPVQLVSSDASGLYVIAGVDAYQCPGCRRWNKNDICCNTSCPLYGK